MTQMLKETNSLIQVVRTLLSEVLNGLFFVVSHFHHYSHVLYYIQKLVFFSIEIL